MHDTSIRLAILCLGAVQYTPVLSMYIQYTCTVHSTLYVHTVHLYCTQYSLYICTVHSTLCTPVLYTVLSVHLYCTQYSLYTCTVHSTLCTSVLYCTQYNYTLCVCTYYANEQEQKRQFAIESTMIRNYMFSLAIESFPCDCVQLV